MGIDFIQRIEDKEIIDNAKTVLAPKEREIIDGLLSGETESQIARRLGRDRQIISYHKHRAFKKMREYSKKNYDKRLICL